MFLRTTIPIAASLALTILLPWGCGQHKTQEELPPDLSDPMAAMQSIATRTCEKAHYCREDYPYASAFPFELFFGTDVEKCVADFTKSPEDLLWLPDSLAAGRVLYHQDLALECWYALVRSLCPEFWMDQGGEPCDTMFEGTLEDGEFCVDQLECITDRCDPMSDRCRATG